MKARTVYAVASLVCSSGLLIAGKVAMSGCLFVFFLVIALPDMGSELNKK